MAFHLDWQIHFDCVFIEIRITCIINVHKICQFGKTVSGDPRKYREDMVARRHIKTFIIQKLYEINKKENKNVSAFAG